MLTLLSLHQHSIRVGGPASSAAERQSKKGSKDRSYVHPPELQHIWKLNPLEHFMIEKYM